VLKLIYTLLTDPLGLPIGPLWEYAIFLIVGELVHEIAWAVSPGGRMGSFIYWITKLIAFVVIWAILYGCISLAKFIVAHWIWFALGAAVLVSAIVVFIVRFRKRTTKQARKI